MRVPKFNEGDVVRVANPDRFVSSLAKRIADRDAILIRNVYYAGSGEFSGSCTVEFQKRNGRGKVFTERFYERELVLASDVK